MFKSWVACCQDRQEGDMNVLPLKVVNQIGLPKAHDPCFNLLALKQRDVTILSARAGRISLGEQLYVSDIRHVVEAVAK